MFAVNSPFIPCLGSIAFFVILFGFIIFMRYLNYKETLALAEKGLVRPQAEAKDNSGKGLLLTGMIFAAIGLGVSVGLLSLGFSPWMIVGLVPLFLGLGLVLVYVLTREPKEKGEDKELKNKAK
jgi:preprotein translocase subunit SecG